MQKEYIIYFVKTNSFYFNNWEYYQVDKEILENNYKHVIVSHNILKTIFILLKYPKSDLFCWWWHTSAPIIILAWILKKKIICTGALHMFDCSGSLDFYKKNFIFKLLTKISLRLSDINIFISYDQLLSVTSHLKVTNPIMIYSSLSSKKSIAPTPIDNINKYVSTKSFKLLFVGWLTEQQIIRKSLLEVIKALDICINKYKLNLSLTIAGKKGDALDLIKNEIIKQNVQNFVNIELDITEKRKHKLYLISDLFVNPSYMEGFGNATLEAMSFGCPSLVSRYGASPEVISDSGIIINIISCEEISKGIRKFCDLDKKTRENMRETAYYRAYKEFNFQKRLSQFKRLC